VIKRSEEETLRVLVGLGSDVHVQDEDGFTSLHLAARFGHIETVEDGRWAWEMGERYQDGTDGWMGDTPRTNGSTNGRTDGTDGWTDGRTDGRKFCCEGAGSVGAQRS
jgi:hypothetical protein